MNTKTDPLSRKQDSGLSSAPDAVQYRYPAPREAKSLLSTPSSKAAAAAVFEGRVKVFPDRID